MTTTVVARMRDGESSGPCKRHSAMPRWRRPLLITAVAVVVAAASAGCGGAKEASKKSGETGARSPVTVSTVLPLSGAVTQQPSPEAAAKASVKEINAKGGLNGHPLRLVICDSQDNPNVEGQCARQAGASGAVATVGSLFLFNEPAVWKLIEAAKLP